MKTVKMEKFEVGTFGLHGDLVITCIDNPNISGDFKKVDRYTLVVGQTGNHHVLTGEIIILKKEDEKVTFWVKDGTILSHEGSQATHHSVELREGFYEQTTQSEIDHVDNIERSVID